MLDIRRIRNVAMDRYGPAAGAGNFGHNVVCDVAAARVVHHDGSTRGRQLAGDFGADFFR